jgi:hypothetical protein
VDEVKKHGKDGTAIEPLRIDDLQTNLNVLRALEFLKSQSYILKLKQRYQLYDPRSFKRI